MKTIITKVILGVVSLALSALCLFGMMYIYDEFVYAVWNDAVLYGITLGIPWLMGLCCAYLSRELTRKPREIVVIKNESNEDVSKEEAA